MRVAQVQGHNFGLRLGWVDFSQVAVAATLLLCMRELSLDWLTLFCFLCRWNSGRISRAAGHHGGKPKSKSTQPGLKLKLSTCVHLLPTSSLTSMAHELNANRID